MNIFFTGAVRGGRAHQPEYAVIVDLLKKHGTVFSSHVSDDALSQFGETHLTAEEVVDRELGTLATSDLVVAEVTTPSLGVGYLIREATAQGKRVVALYKGPNTLKLSAIIKGDTMVEVHTYETNKNLGNILTHLNGK